MSRSTSNLIPNLSRWALAAFLGVLLATPASADIASFNAAVKANNYKLAAQEAANTWPTLDKSRDDIAIIANEFGFFSFLAEEYQQARDFARFAAENTPNTQANRQFLILANILHGAAGLKLDSNRNARDALQAALEPRLSLPGFDMITYFGANALVVYDIESGRTKDAIESARLAAQLTEAAGEAYRAEMRRFNLYEMVAAHTSRPTVDGLKAFNAVTADIVGDMNDADADEQAAALVPVYWQSVAWAAAMRSALMSDARTISYVRDTRIPMDRDTNLEKCDCDLDVDYSERASRVLQLPDLDPSCKSDLFFDKPIIFPANQANKRRIGAVILAVDVGKSGRASNGRLLAAVPEAQFAEAVMSKVSSMYLQPDDNWDSDRCTLESQNRVVEVNFLIK